MVAAFDRDKSGTPNSTFHYEIKSVSPNPPDTEFFIDEKFGTISFKGCLDHEASIKYMTCGLFKYVLDACFDPCLIKNTYLT